MNILHVYKTYITQTNGGIEQAMRQMILSTEKQGINNRVFCLGNKTQEQGNVWTYKKNIEIASTGFSWEAISGFKKCVAWADIIHYQYPWPFADMLHFLAHVKKPTVLTYQSDIIRQKFLLNFYRPLQKAFLKSVDKIIVTSPNYVSTSQVLKNYQDKINIIPIGLDKKTYPEITENKISAWKQKVGEKFFLFIGVLRYYKGLHILLKACENTNFPVVIVGAGPIEGELKKQAEKLNLSHVKFLGEVSDHDKVALLYLSKAIVFPSHLRSEAFGVSLLEGAMFGKPLISSEIGTGTSFINIDQETGFVVSASDPEAFRAAMKKLDENSALCEQMGNKAYHRYLALFTADKAAQAYLSVYNQLKELNGG